MRNALRGMAKECRLGRAGKQIYSSSYLPPSALRPPRDVLLCLCGLGRCGWRVANKRKLGRIVIHLVGACWVRLLRRGTPGWYFRLSICLNHPRASGLPGRERNQKNKTAVVYFYSVFACTMVSDWSWVGLLKPMENGHIRLAGKARDCSRGVLRYYHIFFLFC